MHPSRFINVTNVPLMENADNGEGCSLVRPRSMWEISILCIKILLEAKIIQNLFVKLLFNKGSVKY